MINQIKVQAGGHTKSYSTFAKAQKTALDLLTSAQGTESVRFVVAACENDPTRFSPVFFLTKDNMWMAISFASRGFNVVG